MINLLRDMGIRRKEWKNDLLFSEKGIQQMTINTTKRYGKWYGFIWKWFDILNW